HYINVRFRQTAHILTTPLLQPPAPALFLACGMPVLGVVSPPINVNHGEGNSCSPNFSFYEIGTRTQYNPTPQLDIGLEVLYTHLNTAYKGTGITSGNGSQTGRNLVDDQNVWSAMVPWQRNFYP